MPKKKTGQRKKAEKQRVRQKEIRNMKGMIDFAKLACNLIMVSLEKKYDCLKHLKFYLIVLLIYYLHDNLYFFFDYSKPNVF